MFSGESENPISKDPDSGEYEFRFWTTSRLLKLFIFVAGCLLVATGIQFAYIGYLGNELNLIQEDREIGRQNGYVSRAQTCRVQKALALPLNEACLDENVTAHYDAEEQVLGSSFREDSLELLCRIAVSLDLELPTECT